jgi:hypothetical protein
VAAAVAPAATRAKADDEEEFPIIMDDFQLLGADIMKRSPPSLLPGKRASSAETFNDRWISHFNTEPEVCFELWTMIQDNPADGLEYDFQPEHLLWALLFLKLYNSYTVLSGMCDCHEDTYSDWVWRILQAIMYLEDDVVRTEPEKRRRIIRRQRHGGRRC